MKPAPFDWWKLYHDAMTVLPWASPDAVKRLTIPQLVCLTHERPPSTGKRARTAAEYEAMVAELAEQQRAWTSDEPPPPKPKPDPESDDDHTLAILTGKE